MKTVFKVGMVVYDNIFFPNSKGKVVRIDEHYDCERVIVRFDNWDYDASYTEKGRLVATYKGATPTLSTSPYTLQGFEQKASAPTYEEAVNWIENNKRYNPAYVEIDEKEKVFLSETYFYAFEALRKLIILRDYYNEGWQPDWNNRKQTKYTIEDYIDELWCEGYTTNKKILSFKNDKIRDKFLEEQKELLEIAKPLL